MSSTRWPEDEARQATESAVKAAAGSRLAPGTHGRRRACTATASRGPARAARRGEMVMIHQPVHPVPRPPRAGWTTTRPIAEAVPDTRASCCTSAMPGSPARRSRELGEHCPNVIGVKYGVRGPGQLRRRGQGRRAGPLHLAGRAGRALPRPGTGPAGATGFTSGLVNVAPRLSRRRCWTRCAAGDFAGAMTMLGGDPAVRGAARGRRRRRTTSAWSRRRWHSSACAAGRSARPARLLPRSGPRTGSRRSSRPGSVAGRRENRHDAKGRKTPARSCAAAAWFGSEASTRRPRLRAFSHRSRMRQLGYPAPRSTSASR